MGNVGYNVFMGVWSVFDAFFGFIDGAFRAIFSAIPDVAMAFLIAIFCYSLLAICECAILRKTPGDSILSIKVFYGLILVLMVLFSVWRLGFIVLLEDVFTMANLAQFLVNLIYIIFGAILIVSFYRKMPHLKNFTYKCKFFLCGLQE